MNQQYTLGKFLKQRYNDLLSSMYNRSEVSVRLVTSSLKQDIGGISE